MKKTLLILSIFSLFSAANAQNKSYEPIHNLVPLSYNPLTTNYNPDYDNYSAFNSTKNKNNTLSVANSSKIQAEQNYQTARSNYMNIANNIKNASIPDMMSMSIIGNQYRQDMNKAQADLTPYESGSGGCGSRGGPGYRKANGQCASWSD